MPNGWKKGLRGANRKIAAGAATLVFCRCARCCRSVARAKAGHVTWVEQTAGGRMASRTFLQRAAYVQRQGAKARDFGKTKRNRVRKRRAARARANVRWTKEGKEKWGR